MTETAITKVNGVLAKKANGNGIVKRDASVEDMLKNDSFKNQMALVLPKHITPDRLARIALSSIRTNPKLKECSNISLMAAVMQSAQLGLEPGPMGQCYFVPFKGQVQFIIGYKGMLELIRRSGETSLINVHIVYENDYMELEWGMNEKLVHIPWFMRDGVDFSGAYIGAYFVAQFKDGSKFTHYMHRKEIEARKKRSKTANNGPWSTDEEAMIKKTVVRDACKWLPLSIEVVRNISQDETVRQEIPKDTIDLIEPPIMVEYTTEEPMEEPTIDQVTGEVIDELPMTS